MTKNLFLAVLALTVACGSASRVGECEIAGCDPFFVDSCVETVEACEIIGGISESTCVSTQITATELACAGDDTDF